MARKCVFSPQSCANSCIPSTGSFESDKSTSTRLGGELTSIDFSATSRPPARTLALDQPSCATARLTASRVTSSATHATKRDRLPDDGSALTASLIILLTSSHASIARALLPSRLGRSAQRTAGHIPHGGIGPARRCRRQHLRIARAIALDPVERVIALLRTHLASDHEVARIGDHESQIGRVGTTEVAAGLVAVIADRGT